MIKYAIFDLDGTLFDTLDTIRYYVNTTIEKHGAERISREECRQFIGKGARSLITRAMQSRGMDMNDFDKVFAEYNEAYDANPYYLTRPYDGISEMIDALSNLGIGLAVLSNKPDVATRGTVEHFFEGKFFAVFGGREGTPLKPDKRALDAVLAALSAEIGEVAYIGDSDVDVLTIKTAEPAMGIAVSWGFRTRDELLESGAELILDSPDEVLKYIKKEA